MLYPNTLYHIYNQSNQQQLIFRNAVDYHDFEEKIRKHLCRVADVLCYCLMPTHFHIMALIKPVGLQAQRLDKSEIQGIHAEMRTLLSSFTQKVNKRYGNRGSLFRAKTKYKPGYADFIPDDFELKEDLPFTLYIPYLRICFRYIHNNPVAARLVPHATDWRYSSALDYAGQRDTGICNYALTEQLLGIRRLDG